MLRLFSPPPPLSPALAAAVRAQLAAVNASGLSAFAKAMRPALRQARAIVRAQLAVVNASGLSAFAKATGNVSEARE